jgi:pimeloyl-ACP methyl ester carboxylesterase
LLIHAGVNDRRSWQYVVERLSPRHRCVAFDMRGFGETTYEREDGWSPITDALAVLDAAGFEQPVVIACSMGGQTAIDLALAHLHRVAGLVLIGAAVRGAPYPDIEEGPTAELNARIESADAAGDVDEVGRLDAEDVQAIDERAAGIIPGCSTQVPRRRRARPAPRGRPGDTGRDRRFRRRARLRRRERADPPREPALHRPHS